LQETGLIEHNEVIMNKTASHSNTPVFAENHSCTKPVLYQHPTAAEMRTPFSAKAKAWGRDFLAAMVVVACIASPIFMVRSCSDDVDRQHAQAVKYQAQFGGGK
jgi:hypothetical protein